MILAKDVSFDNARALGFGNVAHPVGQDGIAVVGAAVLGQEANETLPLLEWWTGLALKLCI